MRIFVWTLLLGAVFNALGWLGNNFLLGADWDAANEAVVSGFAPPWPPVVKEVVTLASDFVYAFALVYFFANAARRSLAFAFRIAFVIWLAGAALTYLVLVNGGFLPFAVAVKTSLLALVIFLLCAPVLPLAFRDGGRA